MRTLGVALFGLGVFLLFTGWNMDTSVATDIGRVSNWQKTQNQTICILVGLASTVTGIGLFVTALLKASSVGDGQCPHCGNGVKRGFPKCASCRSDITWVSGHPCIPGQEQEMKIFLEKEIHLNLIDESRDRITYAYILITTILLFMILVTSMILIDGTGRLNKPIAAVFTVISCLGVIGGYIYRAGNEKAKLRELRSTARNTQKLSVPSKTDSDPKDIPTGSNPPKLHVPPKIKSDPEPVTKANDAKKAFQHALATLAAGNVEAAFKELKLICFQFYGTQVATLADELHRKELEAYTAFSQGHGLYLQKSFDQAISILQSLAQQHPDTQGGIQATKILGLEREALLMYNKAVQLNKGGNSNATIDALKELVLKFPQTRHGEKARIAIEKTKK